MFSSVMTINSVSLNYGLKLIGIWLLFYTVPRTFMSSHTVHKLKRIAKEQTSAFIRSFRVVTVGVGRTASQLCTTLIDV